MWTEVKNINESKSLEAAIDESKDLVFYNGKTFKYIEVFGIPHIGIKIVDDYIIFKWNVSADITRKMFEQQDYSKEKFFAENFKSFCSRNGYFNN